MEIPNRELCEVLFQNKDLQLFINAVKDNYNLHGLGEEKFAVIREKLTNFHKYFMKLWVRSCRNRQVFQRTHSEWMDNVLELEPPAEISHRGRPSKNLEDCGDSTKRRKLHEVSKNFTTGIASDLLVHKYNAARKSQQAKIVAAVHTASPKRIHRIKESIPTPQDEPKKFSPEEALALFLDLGLSKDKYIMLRSALKQKNFDALPSYTKINLAKSECIPRNIEVCETAASSKLQDLLDHTATRILTSMPTEEIAAIPNNNLVMLSKWGCDGSSGQSEYKQKISADATDANLFMLSMVPLRLQYDINEPSTSSTSTVTADIWKNPRPSSVHYCRPIKFEYAKESKEKIKQEVSYMQQQIESLMPTEFTLRETKFTIRHKLFLTMVDGKVTQHLTDTKSSATCTVCHATTKEFSKPGELIHEDIEGNYQFGLSPLHARIRFMEFVLHTAYDLSFGEVGIRNNEENKQKRLAEKARIQNEFRTQMGLIIDTPKQGFGNTNDGNTARRFFDNTDITAEITKINADILRRFKVILNVLSCGHPINANKFGHYAEETAEKLHQIYPWRSLTPTVHKVLHHGKNIIKYHLLPIGELSEEAQESKNKDYRKYRQQNTRKTSRIDQNSDLLSMLLFSSDPLISSIRHRRTIKTHQQDYLPEITDLLQSTTEEQEHFEPI